MIRKTVTAGLFAALMASGLAATAASAQSCNDPSGFPAWLTEFEAEARGAGISDQTINAALPSLRYDRGIVQRDRRQGVFNQSFLEFSDRMVAAYRLKTGGQLLKKHAKLFKRIEADFGVPGPVIVGFWGLETDFGQNMGDLPVLPSLATLAYDCRRPDMFRGELLAALKIIERGDLSPRQMIGSWAGELGQMQFLPRHYVDYGVDYDDDGRVDLLKSVPDVLASTANYIKSLGWRAGEPWMLEVHVPSDMPWEESDVSIRHPIDFWANLGVKGARDEPIHGAAEASLLLPMGRNGPAFLVYPNFGIYTEWNKSLVYATTASYFATRLAGAPKVGRGRGDIPPALSAKEVLELQKRLAARGYEVGEIDGKVGLQTRSAIRRAQLELGLPADSWPTAELLQRLRAG